MLPGVNNGYAYNADKYGGVGLKVGGAIGFAYGLQQMRFYQNLGFRIHPNYVLEYAGLFALLGYGAGAVLGVAKVAFEPLYSPVTSAAYRAFHDVKTALERC